MPRSSVNIARLVYLLVCQAAGVAIALSTKGTAIEMSVTLGLLIGLSIAAIFIGIERLMEGFTLRGFSTATFGLGCSLASRFPPFLNWPSRTGSPTPRTAKSSPPPCASPLM
jgi:hypothetical protein